jgi:hypothetical protein
MLSRKAHEPVGRIVPVRFPKDNKPNGIFLRLSKAWEHEIRSKPKRFQLRAQVKFEKRESADSTTFRQ